jgi:glycine/D-amino acid oxidase-like deaminating enzyme
MAKPRVLVIGAGINGLCAAWALARRGCAVEVFDRGPIPNPLASSWDEHRITRHAYGSMGAYADRMPQAFRLWDALFADIGARHFIPMPIVAFERGDQGWIAASVADMDRLGAPWRDIGVDDFTRAHPLIRPDGIVRAVELGGSGMLLPARILADLAMHLAGRGVVLHAGTDVTDLDAERATIRVGGRAITADHVVVAAGAWVGRLVPAAAGWLVPSRQTVLFLAPPPQLARAWAAAPIYLDLGAEIGAYTLPPRAGVRLKAGDHSFTRQGDPDDPRIARDDEVARLTAALSQGYADFGAYRVLERKVCFYTVTDDEGFVIASMGGRGTLLSACSGHGFKLGPHSGELAADLVGAALGLTAPATV